MVITLNKIEALKQKHISDFHDKCPHRLRSERRFLVSCLRKVNVANLRYRSKLGINLLGDVLKILAGEKSLEFQSVNVPLFYCSILHLNIEILWFTRSWSLLSTRSYLFKTLNDLVCGLHTIHQTLVTFLVFLLFLVNIETVSPAGTYEEKKIIWVLHIKCSDQTAPVINKLSWAVTETRLWWLKVWGMNID